ncbi:hypothetical protein RRG08_029840 [Elysia crispata]|uniref:Uncharacterized protein n=1 Tax=Elysia crispata TaxID=231223 RepID=A0AAE1DJM3_9GAST|nr:hypothetical protein RRG08_029840 [Elysia crispata]
MREERSNSQTSSAQNSRVRAIQSTQLDLERLEQELGFTDAVTKELGNGDTLRRKRSRSQSVNQLKSSSSRSGNNHQVHSENNERRVTNRDKFSHKLPKIEHFFSRTCLEPCHPIQAETDHIGYVEPLPGSPLGQSSDDTNKNAFASATTAEENEQSSGYRFLDQGNNAKSYHRSKSRVSRRKHKSRNRCKLSKREQPRQGPTDGQRVIDLPPNSVLEITSQSALCVPKNRKKDKDLNSEEQSLSLAKRTERSKCPEETKSGKNVSPKSSPVRRAIHPSSRAVDKSNSSRYRITPRPAVALASRWSRHSSASSASSNTSSLTSAGTMRYRSSSARKRSPSYFANARYNRRYSATGSTSSRNRRSRYQYQNFPHAVSSYLLQNRPRSARKLSKISLYRARRTRRGSSIRPRKSTGSVQRRSSKISTSPGQRKRGRPRGSGKKLRASRSVSGSSHSAKAKSLGLLDTVSNLWRSYSFSRNATPAQNNSSSLSSSSCSESWVSRMLPISRSKHQKRLMSHREKAYKYSRVHKDEESGSKGARPRHRSQTPSEDVESRKNQKAGGSVFCSIM